MKTAFASNFAMALASALLAAACTPYSPDIPSGAFSCAATEPRCPENMTCKVYSVDMQLCETGDGGSGNVDAANGLICNNDGVLEPNDSSSNASTVPPRALGTPFRLADLSICPASDKDYYAITVDANATNVEVVVDFASGPPLTVKLFNSNNVEVATGAVTGNRNRAYLPNGAAGIYYAAISGTGNNNYSVDITLSR